MAFSKKPFPLAVQVDQAKRNGPSASSDQYLFPQLPRVHSSGRAECKNNGGIATVQCFSISPQKNLTVSETVSSDNIYIEVFPLTDWEGPSCSTSSAVLKFLSFRPY